MNKSLEKAISLAKLSPILTNENDFSTVDCVVIQSNIPSKDLGIVNTAKGLNEPKWFKDLKLLSLPILVIKDIDKISIDEQEKFYEILKYKTISSVDLPKGCKIIVTYEDKTKVSNTITSLCLID